MNAYQFFLKHAGFSYGNGETKMQGRVRGARQLSKVERQARDQGFTYHWSIDPHLDSSEFTADEEPWQLWQCVMFNAEGKIVNSLHGIDFGPDKQPWCDPYKRVVEAELACEGLTNEPQ